MILPCLFNPCCSHGTCWQGRQKGDNCNFFFQTQWVLKLFKLVAHLWKSEFPILQETAILSHCCRTLWGHFLSLWSLPHLAINWSCTILFTPAEKRGICYNSELNPFCFPLWRQAGKRSFSACRKAPLALRCFTCHLWLISHSAQCLTVIINDNALMDDGCLLNTLLPNRQQCSCSNRYMVKGTSATGRWVHILLGKVLIPAHARSLLPSWWLWWYLWNGLQIPHNKQEWQPQKSSSSKSTCVVKSTKYQTKETTDSLPTFPAGNTPALLPVNS